MSAEITSTQCRQCLKSSRRSCLTFINLQVSLRRSLQNGRHEVQKDERDLLEVLKFGLQFLEMEAMGLRRGCPAGLGIFSRILSPHELRFQRESGSFQRY